MPNFNSMKGDAPDKPKDGHEEFDRFCTYYGDKDGITLAQLRHGAEDDAYDPEWDNIWLLWCGWCGKEHRNPATGNRA